MDKLAILSVLLLALSIQGCSSQLKNEGPMKEIFNAYRQEEAMRTSSAVADHGIDSLTIRREGEQLLVDGELVDASRERAVVRLLDRASISWS